MRNKSILALLFLILLCSCIMISSPTTHNLKINYFYSHITFTTDSTEAKYINTCDVEPEKVTFRYIYQYRYRTGFDTVAIVRDSTFIYYIVEKYNLYEEGPSRERLSVAEFKEYLREYRDSCDIINDTTIAYKGYIWDERVLHQMYKQYIK